MNPFAQTPVVVPTDFSPEADHALDVALEIVGRPEAVHAVHVAATLFMPEPAAAELVSDEIQAQDLKESFRRRHAAPKYSGVHIDVRFGDPGTQIADFAQQLDAGLIVMPSHGRTGLKHLLIGSVAERVVRLAKCPVLVLRGSWLSGDEPAKAASAQND